MLRNIWLEPLVWWVVGAVMVTGICGTIELAVQQNYRSGANDPQIAMAEDAARAIENGSQIDQVIPTSVVDVGSSLSPWVAFYNDAGVPMLSSGKLDGESPQMPQGLLNTSTWSDVKASATPAGEETRVTWQPDPSVRQAIVVVRVFSKNGMGYVVAGRNLREVESREHDLLLQIAAGWGATLIALLIACFFAWRLVRQ